jgi:hypothetical protein
LKIIHYKEGHERTRKIKICNISSGPSTTSADKNSHSKLTEDADDIPGNIARYADCIDNKPSANNAQIPAQNALADDADDMNNILHTFKDNEERDQYE